MKYNITESQKEKLVFKFFDRKNYIQLKEKFEPLDAIKSSKVYFIQESEEYADIVYNYWNGAPYISVELREEIMNFFSMDDVDAEILIVEWVGRILNKDIDILNVSIMSKTSIMGELLKPDQE